MVFVSFRSTSVRHRTDPDRISGITNSSNSLTSSPLVKAQMDLTLDFMIFLVA